MRFEERLNVKLEEIQSAILKDSIQSNSMQIHWLPKKSPRTAESDRVSAEEPLQIISSKAHFLELTIVHLGT